MKGTSPLRGTTGAFARDAAVQEYRERAITPESGAPQVTVTFRRHPAWVGYFTTDAAGKAAYLRVTGEREYPGTLSVPDAALERFRFAAEQQGIRVEVRR